MNVAKNYDLKDSRRNYFPFFMGFPGEIKILYKFPGVPGLESIEFPCQPYCGHPNVRVITKHTV